MVMAVVVAAVVIGRDNSSPRPPAAGRPVSPSDFKVATFNMFNGAFCPIETHLCLGRERVEMLVELLEGAGCPELVALQEAGPPQREHLPAALAAACGGTYQPVWEPGPRETAQVMVLSRLPVKEQGYLDLANDPGEAVWVRVQSPLGELELVAAHFAVGFANPVCADSACPPICSDRLTTNECHAVQVIDFLDRGPASAVEVVAGDLNAETRSSTVRTIETAGFDDLWLLAEHPECGRSTPTACTAGRRRPRTPLDGLDSPSGRHRRRIDYVFARSNRCPLTPGAATLAAVPAEPPVAGLYWPSDHAGVVTGMRCGRSPSER